MGDSKEKKKKKSFLKGLKKEFAKVTWPTKAQTGKQTFAVIVVTIVMAVLIVIVDGLALEGVDKITSLEKKEKATEIVYDGSDVIDISNNMVSENAVSNNTAE